MAGIELAELISELRAELTKARESAAAHELQFEVGPVELELSVVVTREAGTAAKVKFFVVELGGDAKVSDKKTQTIKLTLTPRSPGSDKVLVRGDALAGEH